MSAPSGAAPCCALTRSRVVIGVLLLLLAVTTTGWVLTATREPVATGQPEQARQPAPLSPAAPVAETVDVVVAAKDLPVGYFLSREELGKAVKVKKMPKDALPPAYVANAEELLDKRLTRSVRMEETFNPQALTKNAVITLPEGYDMVSIPIARGDAIGFVLPGSRVDLIATVRRGNKIHALPLLVNVMVLAIDAHLPYSEKEPLPTRYVVSFAVREKDAIALSLAKRRECTLEVLLRDPNKNDEGDKKHDVDEVIKFLADETEWAPVPEVAPAPRPVDEKR